METKGSLELPCGLFPDGEVVVTFSFSEKRRGVSSFPLGVESSCKNDMEDLLANSEDDKMTANSEDDKMRKKTFVDELRLMMKCL